jgi:hypothetical protein
MGGNLAKRLRRATMGDCSRNKAELYGAPSGYTLRRW